MTPSATVVFADVLNKRAAKVEVKGILDHIFHHSNLANHMNIVTQFRVLNETKLHVGPLCRNGICMLCLTICPLILCSPAVT